MRPRLQKCPLYFIFHILCNYIARQTRCEGCKGCKNSSPPRHRSWAKVIVDPPNLLREMTPMRHYFLHPTTRPSLFPGRSALPIAWFLYFDTDIRLLLIGDAGAPVFLALWLPAVTDRRRASARGGFRARCHLRQNRAPEAMCTAYRSQAEGHVEKSQLKHL